VTVYHHLETDGSARPPAIYTICPECLLPRTAYPNLQWAQNHNKALHQRYFKVIISSGEALAIQNGHPPYGYRSWCSCQKPTLDK
jgi:hypothetical protein